jgi:hypothetical protein
LSSPFAGETEERFRRLRGFGTGDGAKTYVKKPYIMEKIGAAILDELNKEYAALQRVICRIFFCKNRGGVGVMSGQPPASFPSGSGRMPGEGGKL